MRPVETDVKADVRDLLPGADFADAFSLVVDDPALDAVTAAHRAIDRPPPWVLTLMALRDFLVRPFGLLTRHDQTLVRQERIGAFPVLSQTRGARRHGPRRSASRLPPLRRRHAP